MFFFSEKNNLSSEINNQITQVKYIPDSTTNIDVPPELNFVYSAKISLPTVVHIKTKYEFIDSEETNNFFFYYFNLPERKYQEEGAGSGVIISDDGYIVTNNHVIHNATNIEVILNDNRSYTAKIIGTDPTTDIALLKIDEKELPFIKFSNSDKLEIGQWVLAIGNPFEYRSTVTAGIISALARNIHIIQDENRLQIESFIQTDAAVNPGNSGGALVNIKGELVGINTAIASKTGSYSGYSFAVPSNLVKKVTEDLRKYSTVQRALLGISIIDVSASLASQKKLSVTNGVYVNNVQKNSAAAEAGVEPGDVIIAINNEEVKNVPKLQEKIAVKRPGETVYVTIIRNNKKLSLNIKLKKAITLLNNQEENNNTNSIQIDGGTFVTISMEEARRIGKNGGVKLIEIEEGKWMDAGIKKGFIITKIDKESVSNIQQLSKIIENKKDGMLVEGYYSNGTKAYYGIGW
ncbi:MAG: Do family serine endopeptidase [Chitinophagaceae bacterium]|nr:Do family serine endopeptidase [Chitinophagaceae bacterium]